MCPFYMCVQELMIECVTKLSSLSIKERKTLKENEPKKNPFGASSVTGSNHNFYYDCMINIEGYHVFLFCLLLFCPVFPDRD